MRHTVTATLFIAVGLLGAGAARAERQPSLDEALAGVLQTSTSAAPAARDEDGGDKLCRTLTDMARRSRKATVCMDAAQWAALVRYAKASKRPALVRVSDAGGGRTRAR